MPPLDRRLVPPKEHVGRGLQHPLPHHYPLTLVGILRGTGKWGEH